MFLKLCLYFQFQQTLSIFFTNTTVNQLSYFFTNNHSNLFYSLLVQSENHFSNLSSQVLKTISHRIVNNGFTETLKMNFDYSIVMYSDHFHLYPPAILFIFLNYIFLLQTIYLFLLNLSLQSTILSLKHYNSFQIIYLINT